MSILVFGGAGFLGSYLVRRLIDEGEQVIALDVAAPDPPKPALADVMHKLKFEFCQGEYLSEVLNMVKKYKADYIVNFAPSYSPELELNPSRGSKLHLRMQINILEAAKIFGVKRVVFASTNLAYGTGRNEIVDEDSLLKPDLLYGACKGMNEYLGFHYQRNFGVDFVALRYSSNYGWGRGQRKLLSRASWAVDLFENPVQGLPVRVPFAAVKNSFVYVKDSVLATLLALRAAQLNRRVFDVVSEPYSKADAAEVVKKLVPDAKIEMDMTGAFGSDSPPERPTLISWQNKTIEKELGYKPRYSLEAGITDYIAMLKTGMFKW